MLLFKKNWLQLDWRKWASTINFFYLVCLSGSPVKYYKTPHKEDFQQLLAPCISDIVYCWPKIISEMNFLGGSRKGIKFKIIPNSSSKDLAHWKCKNHVNLAYVKWGEFETPRTFDRILEHVFSVVKIMVKIMFSLEQLVVNI